jgi:serine/threonine-protein kinase
MPDHLDRLKTLLRERYAIERELGSGGMATVYLAEDLRHHRKVAVKVLRPEIAASLGSERFFREIEVAARLQHPHILPLLDSGEGDGLYWFVMPYVAGESLRDRLAREGELPVHDAVKILAEVVDALAAAHAEGVVHRDIKPDNVMLSGRHALVTDFGVAKAVSEATGRQTLTTAGVALGTPSYMAPEQATADPQLDHRVDIYAAGVLGYEMLTGSPPFVGRSAQEILAAQVTQAPLAISARRQAVPPALEAVLMKCLEKRPADRWQHAEELLAQLEVLATPSTGMTPTQTRPVPAAVSPLQFPRWAAWMAGGALVAAGAFALTLRQSPPALLVLGQRAVVAAEPAFESWPSLSPDGQVIAYDRVDAASREIVVQQVDGGAPTVVTAAVPGGKGLSAISPDGSRMLFAGPEGLYLMATLGGQARVVAARGAFPAWSPDGSRFAYVSGNLDTIYQQGVDQPGRTAIAEGQILHSPAWSGDGEWIAYVEGNVFFHAVGNTAPSTIKLVRATGGTPQVLTDSLSLNTSPVWSPGRRARLFVSKREGGRES